MKLENDLDLADLGIDFFVMDERDNKEEIRDADGEIIVD